PGGAVAELLVAVAHQPLEELAEAHSAAGSRTASQNLAKRGIEAGRAREVVPRGPEEEIARRAEAFALRGTIREHRQEPLRELPPVTQGRPGEVPEALGEFRLAPVEAEVLHHH